MKQRQISNNVTHRRPGLIRTLAYATFLSLGITSYASAQQRIEFYNGYIKEERQKTVQKMPSFSVDVRGSRKDSQRTYNAPDAYNASVAEQVYSIGDSLFEQNLVDFLSRGRIGDVSFLEERIKTYMQKYVENQKHTISRTTAFRDYFEYSSKVVDGVISPEQLQISAVIESGGDPDAISVANAVGLGQFIAETARRCGLVVNPKIGLDQRRDPLSSIKSKAKYLSELTQRFDRNLTLGIAAYNCGEAIIYSTVERLARKYERQGRDVGEAWRLENIFLHLPEETQGHIVAFLANMRFLNIFIPGVDYKILPLHSDHFKIRMTDKGDSLDKIAQQEGRKPSELRRANRHIRVAAAKLPQNIPVYVPKQ